MKLSLLLLTINRLEITKQTVLQNLRNCDVEYELLCCDNGSTDKRVIDFIASLNPKYHRLNSKNEGVGRSFNQLYLRSTGDYICLFPNDILMPSEWASFAIKYLEAIPRAGIAAFDWGHSMTAPTTVKFGVSAGFLTKEYYRCFGVSLFKKSLVEEIGLFHDGYDVYGLEDSDFNERVNRSGFNSFYLPGMKSVHIGHDVGEDSEYRKMKDKSLTHNSQLYLDRFYNFDKYGCVEPLPSLRDPI